MILKEYFMDSELFCKCGCGLMPDKKSTERLYAMRLIWGRPMTINSGARCKSYNEAIDGSKTSKHIEGRAFDIATKPQDEWRLIQIAQIVGFSGIGINDNSFIHVDDADGNERVWSY